MLFIERRFREGDNAAVGEHRSLIEQIFHDLSAFYDVLFHNCFGVFGRHLRVERAFGIHDHDGTERAQAEATRFYHEHVVDFMFFERFFKLLDDLHRFGRGAARSAAYENLFAVSRFGGELFALFFYDAAYFDEVFFRLANGV